MRFYFRQRGAMQVGGSIGYYWQLCDGALSLDDPNHIVADKIEESNIEILTDAMNKSNSEIVLGESK